MQSRPLSTLKRPEYTGENRCLPCTVTNVAIAAVLGLGLAVAGSRWGATGLGVAAGLAAFAVSLAAIYFRGYLVPGTPGLTRRYFPRRVLRRFGKAPQSDSRKGGSSGGSGREHALDVAGLAESSADGLPEEFRNEWDRAIEEMESPDPETVRTTLGIEDAIEMDGFGNAFRVYAGAQIVGKWQTEPAFLVDLASCEALADAVDDWDALPVEDRANALHDLRARVDVCPDCGGEVAAETESVEGCCSTFETTTTTCTDCGTRLYVETCPDCNGRIDYESETFDLDDGRVEAGSASCRNCGLRVFAVPEPLSTG